MKFIRRVFIFLFVLGIIGATFYAFDWTQRRASNNMTAHVRKLYDGATHITTSCPADDADGDGYLTCQATFQMPGETSRREEMAYCIGGFSWKINGELYGNVCKTARCKADVNQ